MNWNLEFDLWGFWYQFLIAFQLINFSKLLYVRMFVFNWYSKNLSNDFGSLNYFRIKTSIRSVNFDFPTFQQVQVECTFFYLVFVGIVDDYFFYGIKIN